MKTTTRSSGPAIRLYNFRTRQLERFAPIGQTVGFYSCGPTVYGHVHIGNLRTFIFEDVLRRTLQHFGYPTKQVMNITDVEDKIIRGASQSGQTIQEFTEPHTKRFFNDLGQLNIEPAEVYPKATEHIPDMIALIVRLLEKELAYQADDGSVYFAIRKFADYGQLARIDLAQLKPGIRVSSDEYDKEAAEDFALWKAAKPEDEAVGAVWDSPWGRGRPGWHIECSAMSMKYLGETFDLHAGGIDLLFPHHEDEIAQSEGATGKPLARFFLEAEHLSVDGQKMAKSLGNVLTLSEIEERGIEPLAFRYLVLSAHYRAKLNFTWASLEAAAKTLTKLREDQYRPGKTVTKSVTKGLDERLADDLDTPGVLAILHQEQNPALWASYDNVLGLGLSGQSIAVPENIQTLLNERNAARANGDYARADQLRDQLHSQGWDVEDTPHGPRAIPIQTD